MTFEEVRNLPRDEQALLSVYSYMAVHPKMILQKVENEPKERTFCVRCFFINAVNGQRNIITFNFFRNLEAQEADRFINSLCDEFQISATGDPVF